MRRWSGRDLMLGQNSGREVFRFPARRARLPGDTIHFLLVLTFPLLRVPLLFFVVFVLECPCFFVYRLVCMRACTAYGAEGISVLGGLLLPRRENRRKSSGVSPHKKPFSHQLPALSGRRDGSTLHRRRR